MPYVNIQITAGATRAQKAELVEDVTSSLVRVLGKKPEHIHVVIQEIREEDWGFAGQLTDDWKRAQAGAKPGAPQGAQPAAPSGAHADDSRASAPRALPAVERLTLPATDSDVRALAALLVDAVDSGAAVSFLAPLAPERAEEWWRRTLASADARAVVLVARDAEGIVGSVQLHPAWAPNQPHRAEIAKLLVHRRGRRAGLGRALMAAAEDAARRGGFRLLTLDAKRGGAADQLYRRLGWTHAGTIPRFALDTDGRSLHDDVLFYKELGPVA